MASNNKFEISVRGEAIILLPAERAVLEINVYHTCHEKQVAYDNVVSAAKKVEALLRKLSPQNTSPESMAKAALDKWNRTSLSEANQARYDSTTQKYHPREYTASVNFDVQFQRFGAIPGLFQNLAGLEHVETDPLRWILTEQTKADNRSALRINAAKDAHSKALEFAEALGYHKAVPFFLQEGRNYASPGQMKKAMIHGPSPDDDVKKSKKNLAGFETEEWEEVGNAPDFQYQPEDVKMDASVDAKFYAA